MFIYGSVYLCCESVCLHSLMGVLSTCVVSQCTFVSRLCSSMGVCTFVVSQFALVSRLCSSMGVCTCVLRRWE